jgi:hypothetical protein
VVERHLLQGMYGIFNSADVLAMQNEAVEAIASENKETRERRITLKAQKKAIEEARDICANLAMRKELRQVGPPSLFRDISGHQDLLTSCHTQYAEEDRDYVETSEDESEIKTPSRRPTSASTVAAGNASVREARRASRHAREDTRPLTPVVSPDAATVSSAYTTTGSHVHGQTQNHGVGRTGNANTHSYAPPPSSRDGPRSTAEWSDATQFYKAPQQPPPPPPRPDKLRAEAAADAGFPPTPDSASGYGFASEADYAPPPSGSRSRVSAKKIFGRA